jgi:hypothetical protein
MTIPIISPEQRLREPRGARILLVGPFGIGKTSQLRYCDPATTVLIDVENGALAVDDVPVPHFRPQTWPEIRDLFVRIVGPNRSFQSQEPYSQAHFDRCGGYLPEAERCQTVFLDTVTAATRLSYRWAAAQSECVTERGKFDQRSAYGLHARETLLALHHLQSARALNVILVGALETVTDPYGRVEHKLQAEGQRVPREIGGIVDIVATMTMVHFDDGKPAQRAFICTSPNPWAYPAKDRSGKLEMLEPPDLGALINKALPQRANHGARAATNLKSETKQENDNSAPPAKPEAQPDTQHTAIGGSS